MCKMNVGFYYKLIYFFRNTHRGHLQDFRVIPLKKDNLHGLINMLLWPA